MTGELTLTSDRACVYEYDRLKRPASALTMVSENCDAGAIGGRVWGRGGGKGTNLTASLGGGSGLAGSSFGGPRCPRGPGAGSSGRAPSGRRMAVRGPCRAPGYVRDRGEIAAAGGRAGARVARRAVAVNG